MFDPNKQELFDVLLGDWVGEIGQLHQKILQLPAAVDAALSPTKNSLQDAQVALANQLHSLPAAADKEMKRASDATINRLSIEVGKIAQQIAGDTAAKERHDALLFASKWVAAGVVACSVIFGGTGYAIRMASDEFYINTLKNKVAESKMQADAAVAAAEKKSNDETELIRKSIGWVGTQEGRTAKKFFDSGWGMFAAECNSPAWEIRALNDGKYCVPKRRPIFSIDEKEYGWKIP